MATQAVTTVQDRLSTYSCWSPPASSGAGQSRALCEDSTSAIAFWIELGSLTMPPNALRSYLLKAAGHLDAGAFTGCSAGCDDPEALIAIGDAVGAAPEDRGAVRHGPTDRDCLVPVSGWIGQHLVDARCPATGRRHARTHASHMGDRRSMVPPERN